MASMNLLEVYAQLCIEADPVRQACIAARAAEAEAEALHTYALESGAIKGEVSVVMKFRQDRRFGGSRLTPFLK